MLIVCKYDLACSHTPCPPARCPSPSALLTAESGGAVLPRGASSRARAIAALAALPCGWTHSGGFGGWSWVRLVVQLDTSWRRPAHRHVYDPASTGWMYRNGRCSAAPHPPQRTPPPPPLLPRSSHTTNLLFFFAPHSSHQALARVVL